MDISIKKYESGAVLFEWSPGAKEVVVERGAYGRVGRYSDKSNDEELITGYGDYLYEPGTYSYRVRADSGPWSDTLSIIIGG